MPRTKLDRDMDTEKSIVGEIRHWIGEYAQRWAWTFERILEWRQKNVFEHDRYKKLPRWATSSIDTAFRLTINDLERKLIWTHVLDGKRIVASSKAADNRAQDIHEQMEAAKTNGEAGSCFCFGYLDGEKLVLVPYRAEDREKEIASGRLSEDDMKVMHKHTAHQVFPHGGNNRLAAVTVIHTV